MICDTGHNVDGIREVVNQIEQQSFDRLWIVLGVVKDKDVSKVLQLLPKYAHYFFCQAKLPRAMDAEELKAKALNFGLRGEVVRDINEAIRQAKSLAQTNDMIFIGGSTFVVAEIDNL
jgi:dihydrofolate synthase/folylpolyglutamate synthase